MNKIGRCLLMTSMIILLLVQVFFINRINKTKNDIVYNKTNSIDSPKTINEINKELNCLKEVTVLSEKKKNEKWVVEVKIQGSKEELLKAIAKFENYDISDYIISKNEGKNSLILEISEKEST